MKKSVLPVIALAGALFALVIVFWSGYKEPPAPIPFSPARSPYPHALYGVGIIEASAENRAIGCPFVLPIETLFVTEGDFVKRGAPLLQLDTRSFLAQKKTAEQELRVAQVHYEDLKNQFSFYQSLQDKQAVSRQDYDNADFAMRQAEAQLAEVETDIERATVRAPVDGEILQVNAHEGEIFIQNSYNTTQPYVSLPAALVLMGTTHPLQMRIDIDEEDAWRFEKGAKATAFVRGNASLHMPLKFLRIEPYIIPKVSYTGDTTERIDTRVFQVLYQFDRNDLPVYPGQLLDVYIEAKQDKR
jgi:HlyD family secretion protein